MNLTSNATLTEKFAADGQRQVLLYHPPSRYEGLRVFRHGPGGFPT